jgi:hypothetical protein
MQTILTIILLLLLALPCQAQEMPLLARMNPYILGSGVAAAASDCPSGTYVSYWTGSYPADTDKICYNSGSGNKDGTNTSGTFGTDYGEGASDIGWKHDSGNDNLSWDISASDLIDHTAAFTVCVRLKWITDGSQVDQTIFESYYDANNYVYCYLDNSMNVECAWKGNTTTDIVRSGSISLDTWFTLKYSVNPGESTAANDHAIAIDAGAWTEENDAPVSMASIPTTIKIGDYDTVQGQTEEVHITSFARVSGYKASCPW